MRLWVFTFEEKCPAGEVDPDYFKHFLRSEGIEIFEQVSKSTFVFRSRDFQDWRYWDRLAKEKLDQAFYYSILELKNSNCRPIGPLRFKKEMVAA